jgi:integrase/recombinase XerD
MSPEERRAPRTPAKQKARELATALRRERPDYLYLKEVFRSVRAELGIPVWRPAPRLPHVPSEAEIRRYYETVWQARRLDDLVLIKTLLYTGVRVSELVAIRLDAVDFDRCQIRITGGKGRKDRVVPFLASFKETLALHADRLAHRGATHLFESSWKKPYSDRGSASSCNGTRRPRAWRTRSPRIARGISC